MPPLISSHLVILKMQKDSDPDFKSSNNRAIFHFWTSPILRHCFSLIYTFSTSNFVNAFQCTTMWCHDDVMEQWPGFLKGIPGGLENN